LKDLLLKVTPRSEVENTIKRELSKKIPDVANTIRKLLGSKIQKHNFTFAKKLLSKKHLSFGSFESKKLLISDNLDTKREFPLIKTNLSFSKISLSE